MARDIAAELAGSNRSLLIAPAGHGKTRAIAEAVVRAGGRQLVLTHTHAGIRSLRRHLAVAGYDPKKITLDTIAGFATRWAAPYPELGGWSAEKGPFTNWDGVHEAATRVLNRPQLTEALGRSYDGLFVDEYQDCTVEQHGLILRLAEQLPTRVVGDPLQGIFGFGNQALVDFDSDVATEFEPLEEPDVPWRWVDSNPDLGADLQRLRYEILAGSPIDLTTYPTFKVRPAGHPARVITACRDVAANEGSVVVIRGQPAQAHALAKHLSGQFVSMEEAEGRAIIQGAKQIEEATGPKRAEALLEVIAGCTTTVVPHLAIARAEFRAGQVPTVPRGKKGPAVRALCTLAGTESLATLGAAIKTLCSYPEVVIFRPEIPADLIEAARLHALDPYPSLVEAATAVRTQGRRFGRAMPPRLVSRTLLVKGLEFDHAIVLDNESFDTHQLYVAMTRATRTVTVLSNI